MARKPQTTEDFIKKAKEKHGNKYDYSLVEYVNNVTKVKIICKEHGVFEQTPIWHLNRGGCLSCSNNYGKLTTEHFIERAKEKHGNKYDYSNTVYIGALKKLNITCKEHGEFSIFPHAHFKGYGCPMCGGKLTYNMFIEKANFVHSNKYNYSKFAELHVPKSKKIEIICPKHGKFNTSIHNHLGGIGCPKCRRVVGDMEDFLRLSMEKYGDKYDYSLVKIGGCSDKIKIICPKHGLFEQRMDYHVNGFGCNLCGNERIGFYKVKDDETGGEYRLKKYKNK